MTLNQDIMEIIKSHRELRVYQKNESESEAAETLNWLGFAIECGYLEKTIHESLDKSYQEIIGMLINMQRNPEKWSI